mgnify:CR=1 FL=1
MEKFKVCEREAKTKAYSKEGLQRSASADPQEKKRMETREWISDFIDTLQSQIGVLCLCVIGVVPV